MQQKQEQRPESVLVMQGGGSLGAYECGVYKTLARHNIWFDVVFFHVMKSLIGNVLPKPMNVVIVLLMDERRNVAVNLSSAEED